MQSSKTKFFPPCTSSLSKQWTPLSLIRQLKYSSISHKTPSIVNQIWTKIICQSMLNVFSKFWSQDSPCGPYFSLQPTTNQVRH